MTNNILIVIYYYNLKGRIPHHMTSHDLKDLFEKYGKLENIEMKRGGYAFVEFSKLFFILCFTSK